MTIIDADDNDDNDISRLAKAQVSWKIFFLFANLNFWYFQPSEHTAADEDKEEEDIWLCNILQVQQDVILIIMIWSSWLYGHSVIWLPDILIPVSTVGSMQLKTQGCNSQT